MFKLALTYVKCPLEFQFKQYLIVFERLQIVTLSEAGHGGQHRMLNRQIRNIEFYG